jgi:hypothetical protein
MEAMDSYGPPLPPTEPAMSPHGPSRLIAAAQYFGRFWGETISEPRLERRVYESEDRPSPRYGFGAATPNSILNIARPSGTKAAAASGVGSGPCAGSAGALLLLRRHFAERFTV